MLAAGAYAENGQYDPLFISNYLDRFVRDDIKRVPGVGDVIDLRRAAATRCGCGSIPIGSPAAASPPTKSCSALREQNVQVAAGADRRGARARRGRPIRSACARSGRLTEPAEFDNIILKRSADGTLVRVQGRRPHRARRRELLDRRCATTAATRSASASLQLPTANSLQVYRDVSAEIDRLSKRFPPGLKVEARVRHDHASCPSRSARSSRRCSRRSALVVLVMFLFLQNWRTTLIPAITIPVSLIGTFAFVKLFGFSINTLTLFGITLATGLVVDDAIVVIENIERHIHEHHQPAREAASDGDGRGDRRGDRDRARARARCSCRWRSFPGTTGRLYQQFALTIAVLDGDLGVQRADADAGAGRRCCSARSRSRRASSSASSTASSTAARRDGRRCCAA